MVLSPLFFILLLANLLLAVLAGKNIILTKLFYLFDLILFVTLIIDISITRSHKLISMTRQCSSRFSFNHKNKVTIKVNNLNNFAG